MKTCKLCGQTKKYEDFPRHSSYADGYYGRCKECNNALERQWRKDNPEKKNACRTAYRERNREKIREMDKEYYEENSDKRKQYQKDHKKNNPKIHDAYKHYRKALSEGSIERKEYCQICGTKDVALDGHHADYDKPLEVIWVCKSCHTYIHKKI